MERFKRFIDSSWFYLMCAVIMIIVPPVAAVLFGVILLLLWVVHMFGFGRNNEAETYKEVAKILATEKAVLAREHNRLVNMINEKGGQEFLDNATLGGDSQFTQEEIKTMVSLCHPDKHGQRKSAVSITQKLNSMRK